MESVILKRKLDPLPSAAFQILLALAEGDLHGYAGHILLYVCATSSLGVFRRMCESYLQRDRLCDKSTSMATHGSNAEVRIAGAQDGGREFVAGDRYFTTN